MWIQTTIGLIDTKEIDIEENKIVIPVNEKKQIVETYSSHDVCEKILDKIAYNIKQGKLLFKLPTQADIDNDKKAKEKAPIEVKKPCMSMEEAINLWNTLADQGFKQVSRRGENTKSGKMLKARLLEYTKEQWEQAIDNIRRSELLKKNQQKWFDFDWFVCPSNFVKVLDGKYNSTEDRIDETEVNWWKE